MDLILIDIPDILSTEVYTQIANYNRVRYQITFEIPESKPISREVFAFRDANWDDITTEFQQFDWTSLEHSNPDDGAEFLTRTILEICARYLPTKAITEVRSKHPWMNDRCKDAVRRKLQSSSYEQFQAAAASCS